MESGEVVGRSIEIPRLFRPEESVANIGNLVDASMSSVIYVQCENFCSHRYFHPSYGASPPGHPLSHYSFSPPAVPFRSPLCSCVLLLPCVLSISPLLPGFRCSVPLGESRRFERERKREKLRVEGVQWKSGTMTCLYIKILKM